MEKSGLKLDVGVGGKIRRVSGRNDGDTRVHYKLFPNTGWMGNSVELGGRGGQCGGKVDWN